jgi:hypothetical protein
MNPRALSPSSRGRAGSLAATVPPAVAALLCLFASPLAAQDVAYIGPPAIVEVAEGDSARVLIYSGEWLGG